MKKLYSLLFLIFVFISGAIKTTAQTASSKLAIGIHSGLSRTNDDINNYFNSSSQEKIGRISIQKYISPRFNVSLAFNSGDISTNNTKVEIGNLVTTTIRSSDVMLDFKPFPAITWPIYPYISAGAGILYSDNYLARNQYSLTIPLGIGLRILVFENINFDFNVRQDGGFNDKLDGWDGGKYNDNFMTFSFGLIFKLGKKMDLDNDGITDKKDNCPNTGPNIRVDKSGCPVDNDGDGIDNLFDKCPENHGLAVFNGCPDSDGDGIENSMDLCPDAFGLSVYSGCPDSDGDGIEDSKDECPANFGLTVFNGCPDSDKDGIDDRNDECPDAFGLSVFKGCPDTDGDGVEDRNDICPTVNGLPAYAGCPEPKKDDIKKLEIIASKINFETGKTILKPESFKVLDQVVWIMKDNPSYRLSIEGHTDNVGSSKMNLDLSQARADAVREYLINKGCENIRVVSSGFGDSKPIDSNSTSKGRAKNRRSELKLF